MPFWGDMLVPWRVCQLFFWGIASLTLDQCVLWWARKKLYWKLRREHLLIIDSFIHPNKNEIAYIKWDHSSKIRSTMNGFTDDPTCENNPTTWISTTKFNKCCYVPTKLHPPKEQNKSKWRLQGCFLGGQLITEIKWIEMIDRDMFTRKQSSKFWWCCSRGWAPNQIGTWFFEMHIKQSELNCPSCKPSCSSSKLPILIALVCIALQPNHTLEVPPHCNLDEWNLPPNPPSPNSLKKHW